MDNQLIQKLLEVIAANARTLPVDKYMIAHEDTAGSIKYYGHLDGNPSNHWYILRNDTTAGTFLYASGSDNYANAWTGRATLDYRLPNAVDFR